MKIRIGDIDNLVGMYIALIGAVTILIALPLSIDIFVHIGTLLIAVGCALHMINVAFSNFKNINPIVLFLLIIYVFSCAIMCLTRGSEKYVSAITFLELPIFLVTLTPKTNYKKFIHLAQITFLLLSFYFFYLSFTEYAHMYNTKYGIRQVEELTLGFTNANETGMYLFACLIVVLSGFFDTELKGLKAIFSASILINVWLIIKTQSRVCIIIAFFSVFFAIVFRRNEFPKSFKWFLFSFSFLYVPITLTLTNRLMTWTILGEAIETGRLLVYNRAIGYIQETSAIFGNFGCLFENFHNTPLTILTTVGLVGLALFYVIIIRAIQISEKCLHDKNDRRNKIAYLALIMIILHSSVESAFFSSGSVYAVLVVVIYVLSINDYSIRN